LKIRSLLIKAIILPITLLFLSESYAEDNGLELKVSEMEDIPFGFVHTGKYSPEGNVLIVTEEIDHGIKTLAFRTFKKKTYS